MLPDSFKRDIVFTLYGIDNPSEAETLLKEANESVGFPDKVKRVIEYARKNPSITTSIIFFVNKRLKSFHNNHHYLSPKDPKPYALTVLYHTLMRNLETFVVPEKLQEKLVKNRIRLYSSAINNADKILIDHNTLQQVSIMMRDGSLSIEDISQICLNVGFTPEEVEEAGKSRSRNKLLSLIINRWKIRYTETVRHRKMSIDPALMARLLSRQA